MTSHDFEHRFYIQIIRYKGRMKVFSSMGISVFPIFFENISGWRKKQKTKEGTLDPNNNRFSAVKQVQKLLEQRRHRKRLPY